MLATVRGDDLPRIHPVNVAIVDGGLYAFIIARSPKRLDLELDGRYAMHTHQDPAAPSEVALRGHARMVTDAQERANVAAGWAFEVDDGYALFEFDIEVAPSAPARAPTLAPPRYSSWKDTATAA